MFRPVSVIIRFLQFLLKSVTYLLKLCGDVEISSSLRGFIHYFMGMDAGMVVCVGVGFVRGGDSGLWVWNYMFICWGGVFLCWGWFCFVKT